MSIPFVRTPASSVKGGAGRADEPILTSSVVIWDDWEGPLPVLNKSAHADDDMQSNKALSLDTRTSIKSYQSRASLFGGLDHAQMQYTPQTQYTPRGIHMSVVPLMQPVPQHPAGLPPKVKGLDLMADVQELNNGR
jgi:hypothetical protein